MRNTYIFEVLETFTRGETEAFRQFLASPYFNNGFNAEKHQTLFQLWMENRQPSTPDTLSREQVYSVLFPHSPGVEGKLDKLVSEFKKLLQTFLLVQRYLGAENQSARLLHLAMDMRSRGLEEKYGQAFQKAQKTADAAETESMDGYLFRYQLALEAHEWNSTYNKAKGDLNIPEVLFYLDQYYFAQRLEMLNRLLLQQKLTILPPAASIPIEEAWTVPDALLASGSLIRIPWKIHSILKAPAPTIDDFEQLLHLLQTHENRISPVHLKEYYTYLRNLCTILITTKGHAELRPVLFQINIDNLSRGYFYYEGKIPPNSMLNITQIAINANALQWANDFVEQHRDLIIGENETRDFYRMNKALCFYAEKKYEAALDIIPFGSSYSFYHLMARRLELKIYYELDSDLLPYKIDAFKMFISRAGNKILSKDQHDLHVNFINLVRQLSLTPRTRNKARSEQLIRRIEGKKLVAERSWLLEKARAFGAR